VLGVRNQALGERAQRASLCFVVSLSLLPFTFHLSPAYAVEVTPMRLEQTIPEDRPSQGTLEITNPTPHPVQVRIRSGRYRFFQPGLELPSSQDWFTFEPDLFTLAAGTSSSVRYTITPPPQREAGCRSRICCSDSRGYAARQGGFASETVREREFPNHDRAAAGPSGLLENSGAGIGRGNHRRGYRISQSFRHKGTADRFCANAPQGGNHPTQSGNGPCPTVRFTGHL